MSIKTLDEVIASLQQTREKHGGSMPCVGIVGSSGTVYEIGSAHVRAKAADDSSEDATLEHVEDGTRIAVVYLGN